MFLNDVGRQVVGGRRQNVALHFRKYVDRCGGYAFLFKENEHARILYFFAQWVRAAQSCGVDPTINIISHYYYCCTLRLYIIYNMHTTHRSIVGLSVVVSDRSFYNMNPPHSHTRELFCYIATGREDPAPMYAENRYRHSHSTTVSSSVVLWERESQLE